MTWLRSRVVLVAWALFAVCFRSTAASAHSIGDLVFCDVNGNGVFDRPADTGIGGVTVVLNCGGTVTTTVTNSMGRYAFQRVPATTCRVSVDSSSAPVAGFALSTPRTAGPPPPPAEHSPFPGFGCGTCPNAFVTTVVADGVYQTTVNNPCNCVDPGCAPTGPDPCFGPSPFVGYYGDDFGFLCTTSTTTTSSTTTSSTTTSSTTTSSTTSTTTTSTICPPFPFLIRTTGKIGGRGQVTGSIGANDAGGSFRFGKNVFQSDGSTVAAENLGLGEGTSVDNVLGQQLRKGSGVIIRGRTGTPSLPLTSPFCPMPDVSCGSPDVLVGLGESVGPLPPGSYGRLTILRGGTLTLAPGTFDFCSVKTSAGVAITITGSERSTINVVGTFRLANASRLTPASGTPTPTMNVAGALVRVSNSSILQAFVTAPDAVLSLGRQATLSGAFCANTSRSDRNVHLFCPPPSPSGAFLDGPPALF